MPASSTMCDTLLRTVILMCCSSGQLQQLQHGPDFKSLVQDMGDAAGPELRRLASLGASGRHLQNVERDLMRYVGDEAAWPNCV
jgi:hypothetical protein